MNLSSDNEGRVFWKGDCYVCAETSTLLPSLSSSALRLSTHFRNLMGS